MSARVDERGIVLDSAVELIVDFSFDGRRIWSAWLHRDGSGLGNDAYLVAWPPALKEFLDGTTRLTVSQANDGPVLFDEEISLGSGEGRIAVVNPEGQPIALDKSLRRVITFDSRTTAQMQPLLDSMETVLAALSRHGIQPFLAYGTALGAIRDGKVIGHDSDADLGYVSAHDQPHQVIRESFALQRALVTEGFRVTRYSGAAFKVDVIEPDGSVRGLDVFGGFFREGHLHLMGEIRVPADPSWVYPLGTAQLEGRAFPVPADTDKFLSATYGPNWRTPDPAFHFETPPSTYRRFNGWFRGIRVHRGTWDAIYSKRAALDDWQPSALALRVLAEFPAQEYVDVGCGRGRDTLAYSGAAPAVGLDFVPEAFEAAALLGAEAATFRYFNALEVRSTVGTGVWLAHRERHRVVVARHLLDCLSGPGRAGLMKFADLSTRSGGVFINEFLVERSPKVVAIPRARPLAVQSASALLKASGAAIVDIQEIDHEGYRTCQMVARWPR